MSIAFIFCLSFYTSAQYRFDSWTTDNGLPQNSVYAIAQTPDGYIWFTTLDGLVRFDGVRFTVFSKADFKNLASNRFTSLFAEADGTLWFGTFGGLAFLERGAGRNKDGEKTEESFTALTEKDGVDVKNVREIYEDGDGVMWFGSYDGGLARMKDNKFTNYTTMDGLFSNGVFRILEDERGNFWMSSNQGIFRVNKQELNDFADGKISGIVSTVYGNPDGMLNTEKTYQCRNNFSDNAHRMSDF